MSSQHCGFASEQIATPQTVLHMSDKGKPGRTSRIWFRPVMRAQETANNIFIDVDAESQRDMLGNAGTTPVGITSLESTACCFRPSARVGQDRVSCPSHGRDNLR